MTTGLFFRLLRDGAAILTAGVFMFPLFWWGLTSIKPVHAIFSAEGPVWTGFTPTLDNYRATLLSPDGEFLASRQAIADSLIVAAGATLVTLLAALPAAYSLSMMRFRLSGPFIGWVVFHRVMPPIAALVPLLFIYHQLGLRDTHAGIILAHAGANLPLAVLLLKSFFDDVPREVGEAAMIDGATGTQRFLRIHAPLIRGGVAATAILCFVFSWTEFLMSLFLTSQIRLLPVQLSLIVSQTWGFTSALATAGMLPVFLLILLVQRHLVRGLTMGLARDH